MARSRRFEGQYRSIVVCCTRTGYLKFHIDKTAESSLCRTCNEKVETVKHIVSGCKKRNMNIKDDTIMQKSLATGRYVISSILIGVTNGMNS